MFLTADLFGSKHLMGIIISVAVIGLMFVLSEVILKRDTKKVLLSVLVIFYVLEIIKIVYIWWGKDFPISQLPFQLCSLPLYLLPIIVFCKNEKILKFVYPALVGGLLFGGIVAIVYPVNIIGNGDSFFPFGDNVLPWLSFVYHPLMIYTAIYVLYSELYEIRFKKFVFAYPVIIVFMAIAMIMNVIFDKDFMLLNRGSGSPFQFLIETSQILYVMVMVLLGLFAVFVFHSLGVLINKLIHKDM